MFSGRDCFPARWPLLSAVAIALLLDDHCSRFVNSLNLYPGTQDASTLPKEDYLPLSSNPITPIPSSKRKDNPRDTGGQANKFCIFKLENGQEKLVYNIECKPPFKFLTADICQGLQGKIFPDQDLINKEDEAPEYCTRRLVSFVITQSFSYLIKTGVRYCIAHAFSNVTSYRYLFIRGKQPQSTGYQALFGGSNLLPAGRSGVWTCSFEVARYIGTKGNKLQIIAFHLCIWLSLCSFVPFFIVC